MRKYVLTCLFFCSESERVCLVEIDRAQLVEVGLNAQASFRFGSPRQVQVSISHWSSLTLDCMLRGRPAYECGQAPLKSSCNAGAPSFSQIHTQVFLGRLVVQVGIACPEVGQYECGQGEEACWQVNFTGQHSFCIFGQTPRRGRVL